MLKKQISKIALIIASILFIQPYLSVVATLTVSATTTVEITNVVNQQSLKQNELTFTQTATKISPNQLEVVTTLMSEQPLAELMLKQTISNQFSVQRDSMNVKVEETAQVLSKVGGEVPLTLTNEPITPASENEQASFTLGGNGQNLVFYGKTLNPGTTYTVKTLYDLINGATSGDVKLLSPATLDYRLYESDNVPTALDISSLSPVVSVTEIVPPVEESPEVIPPTEVVPPVEESPEVIPPTEVVPPVEESPEVTPPTQSDSIEATTEQPKDTIAPVEVETTVPELVPFAAIQPLAEISQLTLDKTVARKDAGYQNYEVTLDINGVPSTTDPIPVDIVLVLDKSGSMGDGNPTKISKLVTAAESFVTTMITADTDVKMSLVNFSTTAANVDFDASSTTNYWTSSTTAMNNAINDQTGGWTNIDDAYMKANTALQTARPAAKKFVVLFTDGLPTAYVRTNGNVVTNANFNTAGSEAQASYNQILTNYDPDPAMYAIGLFTGSVNTTAQDFLFNIQNQETVKATYLSKYYTSNPDSLNTIFTTLANSIKASAVADMALNSIVKDVITPQFLLATTPNFRFIDHSGTEVPLTLVTHSNPLGVHEVRITKVTCDLQPVSPTNPADCDQFEVNLNSLKATNAKIKYDINLREPGFYGNDIPTNVVANITYKHPVSSDQFTQEFPIPSVTIPAPELEVNTQFDKTATAVPGSTNLFEIALSIAGQIDSIPGQNARIVIAIDTSTHSAARIAEMKAAIKTFMEQVITADTQGKITINIITYDLNANNSSGNFTRDLALLNTALTGVQISNKAESEMGDAFSFGGNQLDTGNQQDPTALRFLVVVAGGLPTETPTKTTQGFLDVFTKNPIDLTTVFTVGLFPEATSAGDQATAFTNFAKWQNAAPKELYKDTFYPNGATMTQNSGLVTALDTIAEIIIGRVYDVYAYEARIEDIVKPEFKIVANSWSVTGVSETQDVTYTPGSEDKIEVDLGRVPQYDGSGNPNIVTLKFTIEPRNPYYGTGMMKIPTNVSAEFDYINPINLQPVTQTAESPLVALPFVEGTVTVIKDVTNLTTDQRFSIEIFGPGQPNNNQKFGFEVSETASETMSFYMKAPTTDITPNTDYSKNYVTIGEFNIAEYVPQNYELVKIEYHYGDNIWVTYNGNNPFVIDKDHRAVYIRVTNEMTNTDYWYDNTEVENVFPFTFMNQEPTALSFGKEEESA